MKSKNKKTFSLDSYLDDKPKRVVIRKKRCSSCREWKPITEFYKRKKGVDRYRSECIECDKKRKIKTYNKNKMRNKNRDLYNNSKKECSLCKELKVRSKENWHKDLSQKDGLRTICIKCVSILQKEGRYNITEEEYDNMIKKQKGRCKICGVVLKRTGIKGFIVDHNHKNGDVRGLLCGNCNRGIGILKDNPFILFRAIKYVRGELDK